MSNDSRSADVVKPNVDAGRVVCASDIVRSDAVESRFVMVRPMMAAWWCRARFSGADNVGTAGTAGTAGAGIDVVLVDCNVVWDAREPGLRIMAIILNWDSRSKGTVNLKQRQESSSSWGRAVPLI